MLGVIAARKLTNTILAAKVLVPPDVAGQPENVGNADPYIVGAVGPFDLKPGDHVLIDATVGVTRPMPGDSEGAITYYRTSQPPPWEGGFAEDHNPVAVEHQVIRATAVDDELGEYKIAQPFTDNILQYEHHKTFPRPCQDLVTQDLPGRFYNLVLRAGITKPGRPDGTFVRVDRVHMHVAVLRG